MHARRLACAELPRDTSAGQRWKEAVKKATTGRQQGLDYVAMANWQFRRTALGMSQVMPWLGLWPDWKQEVALAAHEAERGRMAQAEAFRHFGRAAYAALRAMGFWRPKWEPGEEGVTRSHQWRLSVRLRTRHGIIPLTAL
jgi:hypothetical protein